MIETIFSLDGEEMPGTPGAPEKESDNGEKAETEPSGRLDGEEENETPAPEALLDGEEEGGDASKDAE